MTRAMLVGCLLISAIAAAQSSPTERFGRMRGRAESLGGLSAFLEKYVGDCTDPAGLAECRSNAERYRREVAGKTFFMIVDEDSAITSPGLIDEDRGEFTVNITPFFAASAYALTQGRPRRTDSNGNPVMPFLHVRGAIPDGENASSLQRMFRTRPFRLQVLFTPQGVWTLPKRGGGQSMGVQAKIHAILVTHTRGGGDIGLWTGE